MKLLKRFNGGASQSKGCGHDVSGIKGVDLELLLLISGTVDQWGVCMVSIQTSKSARVQDNRSENEN